MEANKPTLISFLLCDQVMTEENTKKASLIGIFGNIFANQFPAVHPKFVVFTAWLNNNIDKTYKLDIKILDPEGNYLNAKITNFDLKIDKSKTGTYGVFNFINTSFNKEGIHKIEIYLNQEKISQLPLSIERSVN